MWEEVLQGQKQLGLGKDRIREGNQRGKGASGGRIIEPQFGRKKGKALKHKGLAIFNKGGGVLVD